MKVIHYVSAFLIIYVAHACSAQSESPSRPPQVDKVEVTAKAKVEQLENLYRLEAYYQRFSGVVLIQHHDQIIFKQVLGGLDRGISADLDTRFDIGSISKSFTAAAILSLAHKGKLNLQDAINTHLGALKSERWKKVTIHQLLTHTSGIPSIYQTEQGLPIFFPEKEPVALKDLIDKFKNGKLLFKPGAEFSYSNSGYVLLAAIIEQLSGMPFERFMEVQIFQRHGLVNTSFRHNDLTAQPYYGYRKELSKKASASHWSWAIGAGGIQTNLSDLSKWLDVISSDTFLNEKLRRAYLQQHESIGYGYGWQFANGRIRHDGGTAGYISFISFKPETGSRIIVLSNRSFEDINRFSESSNYIRNLVDKTWLILNGKPVETLPEPGTIALDSGNYQFKNGTQIAIEKASDSTYWVKSSKMTPSRIIPASSLHGVEEKERVMNEIAQLLLRKKHWALAKHCNGEMKFVCYSGLFSVGMKMIRKKTGNMQKVTAYFAAEKYGLIRVIGEKRVADLIAYFDEEGKIKGLFENGYYPLDQVTRMLAFPTKSGGLFLDGFNIGEPDVLIEFHARKLLLSQSGRTIEAADIP